VVFSAGAAPLVSKGASEVSTSPGFLSPSLVCKTYSPLFRRVDRLTTERFACCHPEELPRRDEGSQPTLAIPVYSKLKTDN
jgi:hypothetical protein